MEGRSNWPATARGQDVRRPKMASRIRDYLPRLGNGLSTLLGVLTLAGLYAVGRYNFLVFHCLTEAFSICIAIAVFAIFWNTRQFLDNSVYLVLGLGCLFAGVLDLIYIFAYPGMSVFPSADGNIALQAKTVAQWYVSLSCLGAFPFLRRKVDRNVALLIYSTLLALALASIFYWRIFPACLTEGARATPFQRMGLVISCGAYLGALLLLIRNRREFESYVFGLLAATLIAFFIEDFACAVATEMNGFARTVGHLCQIVALCFVYKAFVQVGLTKPYDLLFRSQQQSAEALERQQQFLEAVLDNAQSGIIACDAEGIPTLTNRAFREFHGIPQKGTFADTGAKLFDLYHADGKTLMRVEEFPLFRAFRGEHIRDVEVVVVPKAGASRTVVASGEPVMGRDGVNRGAVVAVHDITDRKRTEEALRRSEEGLRLVLEASGFGWWSIDLVTGAMTADDRCKALFGLPPATAPSFALFLERVFPEDHPIAERHLAEAKLRPNDCEAEYRTVWPDGSLHWLLIKGRSFHDDPAKPFFKGVVMDVTARKQADEALRASEERYRVLVETIPQLAWRASPDGLQIDYNRRWYEYTGQTPAQVRSRGWLAVIHPDDVPRLAERIAAAHDRGEPCEVEYRLRATDGSYRWHLSRTVPVRDKGGQITDWCGCATDIEELKQAQEILELAHNEELQRHRAELAHVARLSMMGELVASLAHELTQPLHAINGYASGSVRRLRKRSDEDAELVAALEQIVHEAVRAAEVIRRVRAFVRKRKPCFSKVSVNHLIEEIVPFSKADLERRHAKMVLDLGENLPAVIADPIQIEQVVMNLVRNGLEAMDGTPAGGRVLGVKTTRRERDMIQVEVRDRGTGLGEGELERVFEPFFTTKPEGMGMGLAISQSIIRAHGGEIWAAAHKDRGCSFLFTLPIAKKV